MILHQQEPLVRDDTGSGNREDESNGGKEGSTPLLSPGNKYPEPDSDYPDLLDLPRRAQESPPGSIASRSTLPDSTRLLPQQLNPAALYSPTRNAMTFYAHPHLHLGRPHSPYSGSVASFASEPPQAIIPPPHRPGYVTLPRRPRMSSWSPANYFPRESVTTPLSPSPTGSSITVGGSPYVKYDNLGRRTTADGSSRNSVNHLDNIGSPLNGLPPAGNYNSATLPSFKSTGPGRSGLAQPLPHISPAAHFNFDPIQENDGPPTPSNENFPSNYGLPMDPIRVSTPISENSTPINTTIKKVPPKPPPKPSKKNSDAETVTQNGDDGTEV